MSTTDAPAPKLRKEVKEMAGRRSSLTVRAEEVEMTREGVARFIERARVMGLLPQPEFFVFNESCDNFEGRHDTMDEALERVKERIEEAEDDVDDFVVVEALKTYRTENVGVKANEVDW